MVRTSLATLAASLALATAGCDNGEPAAPPAPPAAHADHDHDHGHAHRDDGAPTDAHTGTPHDLGTAAINGFRVAVTQIGDAHAGEGATFEIRPAGEGEISAVRAWVGVESGVGSLKVNAPKRGDFYDADLEVPAQLPEGSRLWVEIDTPTGKAAGSFALAGRSAD